MQNPHFINIPVSSQIQHKNIPSGQEYGLNAAK
jgi:hypothetical protein